MKLSNLEMTEKSIDVQENNMLLAEVRRQVNPSQLLRLHSLRSADTHYTLLNLCGGERVSYALSPYENSAYFIFILYVFFKLFFSYFFLYFFSIFKTIFKLFFYLF